MNGEALQPSAAQERSTWGRFPTALDLFAAVLFLRPWDPDDEQFSGLVRRARSDAKKAVAAGRVAVDNYEAFRLLYQGARAQASFVPARPIPIEGHARWERVFKALGGLRHRQRAALVLHDVLGLPFDAVAGVLALREHEARKVVEAGATALVNALGEPVDVSRSLRIAGVTLLEDAEREQPEEAAPSRLPRSVVRTLLAPPIEDVPLPVPKRRGVLLPRLALAASIVMLLGVAFVPALARNAPVPASRPIVPAPKAVVATTAATVATPIAVVRAGDSLWSIAARALGDPNRWPELWALNKHRRMDARVRFVSPSMIRPGWRLRLPTKT